MNSMIKILVSIAMILIAFLSFQSSAKQFKEGEHYSIVAEQTTLKPELREYFSYYCPACRAYEPYLAGFKQSMPKQAKFSKVHVDFMGHTSENIQFMLSKARILAEKTAIEGSFSQTVFNYLQTDRKKVNNEQDIRKLFIASGGNGETFDRGMRSFSVIGQAKKEKKIQDELSKKRHLASVPALIVNGKYLINSRSLDQNNFFKEYNQLIAHLFTL